MEIVEEQNVSENPMDEALGIEQDKFKGDELPPMATGLYLTPEERADLVDQPREFKIVDKTESNFGKFVLITEEGTLVTLNSPTYMHIRSFLGSNFRNWIGAKITFGADVFTPDGQDPDMKPGYQLKVVKIKKP